MPNVTRKIRIPSLSAYTIQKKLSSYSVSTDPTNTVGYTGSNYPSDPDNIFYSVFEWESLVDVFDTINAVEPEVIISSVSFDFYYRYADNLPESHSLFDLGTESFIKSINIKYGFGDLPSLEATDQLTFNVIDAASVLFDIELRGNKKTRKEITLPNTSSFYNNLQTQIRAGGSFFLALGYNETKYSLQNQILETGTNRTTHGTYNQWQELEPYHAPEIILTLEFPTEPSNFTYFDLKYTTQDPTTPQNSPENSLGGFVSSNSVFESSYILRNFSLIDENVQLNEDSEAPDSSNNPIQIGYELTNYNNFASDTIYGLTRERNLSYGKYLCTNDFISQKIFYLDPDKLFNNNPTDENLVHYRCVFLKNVSESVLNSSMTLINPENSDIDIKVAIEVPKFDYANGTLSAAVSSGSRTFTSVSFGFLSMPTDHYKGAHVILDQVASSANAIITSFSQNGIVATFTVDRNLPSISGGSSIDIMPAPSHSITNDQSSPDVTKISNFISHGESLALRFSDYGNTFFINSGVYVWIKRTIQKNKPLKNNTGSILRITYKL